MGLTHTNPGAKQTTIGLGSIRRISAHTTNYTVTAAESGTLFTTEGAGGGVVFTLPAAQAGLWFQFFNAENQDMTVVGDTADNVVVFNDVAADQIAFNTGNEKVGGAFEVWSDGTKWYVAELTHDAQTSVIATA